MSDTIATTDAALDALRERQRELEIDARLIEARQEEVAEAIATLTGRKPRVVAGAETPAPFYRGAATPETPDAV
jgi:hypothetical protein